MMSWSLALLSISAVLPVVSSSVARITSCELNMLTMHQMMLTGDRPRVAKSDDRNSNDPS